jgi:hypothetical protein
MAEPEIKEGSGGVWPAGADHEGGVAVGEIASPYHPSGNGSR